MNKKEKDILNKEAKKTARKYFTTLPKNINGKLVEVLPTGKEIIIFYDLPFPLLRYHLNLLKKNYYNFGKIFKIKNIN